MHTGAYRVPLPLLTSSIQHDLGLIAEVLGVGELALSDHRGAWPTASELARIASECRVGGLISGKAGVVHVHVGAGGALLGPLWEVVQTTTIPMAQFHPTHVSGRSRELLVDAKAWVRAGGSADLTADDNLAEHDDGEPQHAVDALNEFRNEGVPLERVTLSTDAYGSAPVFDAAGVLIGYGVSRPTTLRETVRELVRVYGWAEADALALVTKNVADVYKLDQKGRVATGARVWFWFYVFVCLIDCLFVFRSCAQQSNRRTRRRPHRL